MPARRIVCFLFVSLLFVACEDNTAQTPSVVPTGAEWFASAAWDDGAAVVSVYMGRVQRYGVWRAAEVRDYVIREFLDARELTKRAAAGLGRHGALKANRHVTFNTGMYDYRLMHSLSFERATGALLKGRGSSQDGCGLTTLAWDNGTLRWDSYWEGEGRGQRPLALQRARFLDELGYVARLYGDGERVTVLPSLQRNRVGAGEPVVWTVRVAASGRIVRFETAQAQLAAEYVFDAAGHLARWSIVGREEFRRVVRHRLYYWQKTGPAHRALLEGPESRKR